MKSKVKLLNGYSAKSKTFDIIIHAIVSSIRKFNNWRYKFFVIIIQIIDFGGSQIIVKIIFFGRNLLGICCGSDTIHICICTL